MQLAFLFKFSSRLGKLIDKGYKEVTLTGVDLTSFGDDLKGKPKLGNVLKRLLACHPNLNRLNYPLLIQLRWIKI